MGFMLTLVVLMLAGIFINRVIPTGLVIEETNKAPVWSSEKTGFSVEKNGKLEIDLKEYFSDEDISAVTYLTTTDGVEC